MTDTPRPGFDARLTDLGLDSLPAPERERLWQSWRKQRALSAGYDRAGAPSQEPALVLPIPAPTERDSR